MRVLFEFLVPGVEHAEEADLRAEMLGVGSDLKQRLGAGPEHHLQYGDGHEKVGS